MRRSYAQEAPQGLCAGSCAGLTCCDSVPGLVCMGCGLVCMGCGVRCPGSHYAGRGSEEVMRLSESSAPF